LSTIKGSLPICFGFRYSDFGFSDASNLFGFGYAGLGVLSRGFKGLKKEFSS